MDSYPERDATGEAGVRTLPTVFIAGDALHSLLGKRRPFLTDVSKASVYKTRRQAEQKIFEAASLLDVPAELTAVSA